MTATMLMATDELRLDDRMEQVEAALVAAASRPAMEIAGAPECGCLLSAVGRCPTQFRAA